VRPNTRNGFVGLRKRFSRTLAQPQRSHADVGLLPSARLRPRVLNRNLRRLMFNCNCLPCGSAQFIEAHYIADVTKMSRLFFKLMSIFFWWWCPFSQNSQTSGSTEMSMPQPWQGASAPCLAWTLGCAWVSQH